MDRDKPLQCGGKELAAVLYRYGLIHSDVPGRFKILCPFHNDRNSSMLIDLDKGRYYCFGCGSCGDAFDFVKNVNSGMDDLQCVLEYIRIMCNRSVHKVRFQPVRSSKENRQLYDEAHDYYYGLSMIDWHNPHPVDEVMEVREYMGNRGFLPETLNMCMAKVTYNTDYPVIFPLLDNGEFKGWVCRTDKPHIEVKRKYLYNEGFRRSDSLIGTYGGSKCLIVVEGYIDRIKMLQNFSVSGIKEENVVCLLGWKASDEHLRKIKESGAEYIISALDNDRCGRDGTKYLGRYFNVVRFCYLKGVKDPGEMGVEQFAKMYIKTLSKIK